VRDNLAWLSATRAMEKESLIGIAIVVHDHFIATERKLLPQTS
jgi:hypothetical protein